MGGPLMGFTLPWLDVPVVKITNCLLAPPQAKWASRKKRKGVSAVAPAPMPVRRICCRSNSTGSVKVSSTIKPLRTIFPTASSAARALGLPK